MWGEQRRMAELKNRKMRHDEKWHLSWFDCFGTWQIACWCCLPHFECNLESTLFTFVPIQSVLSVLLNSDYSCSPVKSSGFWLRIPTGLEILYVTGRRSRMFCGCTGLMSTDRPGNTVLTFKSKTFSGLSSYHGNFWVQSLYLCILVTCSWHLCRLSICCSVDPDLWFDPQVCTWLINFNQVYCAPISSYTSLFF